MMPTVLIVTLTIIAAAMFVAFHVPLPHRGAGRTEYRTLQGRPARLLGVGYHLLLLPAVAELPAPEWAKAAGFAWMILDAVLDGAGFAGTRAEVGPFREGVHVVAVLWLLGAGWSNGVLTAVAGTLLAAAFVLRFALSGAGRGAPRWLMRLGAVLNPLWIVVVAVTLA